MCEPDSSLLSNGDVGPLRKGERLPIGLPARSIFNQKRVWRAKRPALRARRRFPAPQSTIWSGRTAARAQPSAPAAWGRGEGTIEGRAVISSPSLGAGHDTKSARSEQDHDHCHGDCINRGCESRYSCRSTTAGSTRTARLSGAQAAAAAETIRTAAAPANAPGSAALRP